MKEYAGILMEIPSASGMLGFSLQREREYAGRAYSFPFIFENIRLIFGHKVLYLSIGNIQETIVYFGIFIL